MKKRSKEEKVTPADTHSELEEEEEEGEGTKEKRKNRYLLFIGTVVWVPSVSLERGRRGGMTRLMLVSLG